MITQQLTVAMSVSIGLCEPDGGPVSVRLLQPYRIQPLLTEGEVNPSMQCHALPLAQV